MSRRLLACVIAYGCTDNYFPLNEKRVDGLIAKKKIQTRHGSWDQMSVDLLRCLVCSICRNSGAFPDEFCVSIDSKYQLAVECLERMLLVVSVYGGSQASFPPTEHMQMSKSIKH